MSLYVVRNLDGDWDGSVPVEAADPQSAAEKWRQERMLPHDHPVAVCPENEPQEL